VYVTLSELEWLILFGREAHKSKYFSELNAALVTVIFYYVYITYQITRCHAPENNKVYSDKRTYNSKLT
jgi:hypothetical protein